MNHVRRAASAILALSTAALLALGASASAAPPGRAERGVATAPSIRLAAVPSRTFDTPTWVGSSSRASNVLYVAEKAGLLWKVDGTRSTLVLDIHRAVRSSGFEDGLLSVAFATDFATSGHMFVYFTRQPDGAGLVRQLTVRDGIYVAGSLRTVLVVPFNPPRSPDEVGGTVWTTPDGMLWLSTGDGGSQGLANSPAQNLGRLAGKILRVHPGPRGGYTIPADNPFVHRHGARGEVWALGLRQPWRVQVDAPTGDVWIADVGQEAREEVDRLVGGMPAGANFGWPKFEGNLIIHPNYTLTAGTRVVRPFVWWDHSSSEECHAVMGGGVYRGPVRALRGWYLYANLCGNSIKAVDPATRRTVTLQGVPGIDTFGTGHKGHMYVASAMTGRVYRIVGA